MRGLLLLAAAFLLVVTACSGENGNGATPTPTSPAGPETATPAPVPGLFIVAPDGTGTSGVPGTRCWADRCVDYLGPVTAIDPVVFPASASLQWQAEGGTVSEFVHAWVAADVASSTITSDGLRVWTVSLGSMMPEPIVAPSNPGEYLLVVFTRYTTGDDVSFGFYVAVE